MTSNFSFVGFQLHHLQGSEPLAAGPLILNGSTVARGWKSPDQQTLQDLTADANHVDHVDAYNLELIRTCILVWKIEYKKC